MALSFPTRKQIVIATFEALTTDYGNVIRQVNDKYNTNFSEYEHTEKNVNRCFELIDLGCHKAFGSVSEKVVSRPSESRSNLQQDLKKEFHHEQFLKLRKKADRIYDVLTN